MIKLFCTLVFIGIQVKLLFSQDNFEIYAGPNTSNIIHIIDGQQILYNHTRGAPFWNYGFQLGINKILPINRDIFSFGIRIQLKGDRNSISKIFPTNELESLRFADFMIPINYLFKLLYSKQIYLKAGISANYLFYQNKNGEIFPFFRIDSFKRRLGLSSQIGINFNIQNRVSAELMYSQGLTNIYRLPLPNASQYPIGSAFTYKHQAFELSILYKI